MDVTNIGVCMSCCKGGRCSAAASETNADLVIIIYLDGRTGRTEELGRAQ